MLGSGDFIGGLIIPRTVIVGRMIEFSHRALRSKILVYLLCQVPSRESTKC